MSGSLFQEADQELAQTKRPSLFDEAHQEMAAPPSIFDEAHQELTAGPHGPSPELPRALMDAAEGAPTHQTILDARTAKQQLRAAGDKEGAKKLQNSIKFVLQPAARNAKRAERQAGQVGIDLPAQPPHDDMTTLEHLMSGIDKPGRAVRALVNAQFEAPQNPNTLAWDRPGGATLEGIWNNKQGDSEQYLKHMRESTALPAQVAHMGAKALGYIPGTVLGTLGALEGAGSDLIHGEVPSIDNMQKTIQYGRDSATQFVELAGADPTSYVGLGGGGSARNVADQALRAGLEAGIPREAAQAFSQEAFKHAPTILGDVHQGEKLAALASKYGVEGQAFANHFGPAGEVAGKTGLGNVMESIRSRPDLVPAQTPGIARAALDIKDEYRPGYQRQAIRQKVSDLRRGMQHRTAEAMGAIKGPASVEEIQAIKNSVSKEERDFAKQEFANWAKEQFAHNQPHVNPRGDTVIDHAPGALGGHAAEEMAQYFDTGMQGLEGAGALAPIMRHWKAVHLSGNPGHLIKDQIGDSLNALAGGLRNPLRAAEAVKLNLQGVKDSAIATKAITGKEYTVREVKDILEHVGAINPPKTGAMGHLDMDMVPGAKEVGRRLEQAALKAKGAHMRAYLKDVPQVAQDVATLGMGRLGKPWAKKWDELFKSTMLLHYLHEGESPSNAVAKMFQVSYDYADPGRFPKVLGAARKVAPLIGWKYRAAAALPKFALENPPGAMTMPLHMAQALNQPDANPAPKWMRERGLSFQVPGVAAGGETQRAGLAAPFYDVASDFTNPPAILDQVHPFLKMGYEQLAGKDSLLDKDMGRLYDPRRNTTRLRLFQPGATHGLAPSVEASPGEFSVSNYADAFLSPQAIALLNKLNLATGASQGLVGRPLTGPDLNEANNRKLFNAFSGLGLTPTNPATGVTEGIYAPETEKAAKSKGKLKKLKKSVKKSR